MYSRIKIAKELVGLARILVARDWTADIKKKRPDLDADEVNKYLRGLHNPKKEKMIAYWMLDKKTIGFPLGVKEAKVVEEAWDRIEHWDKRTGTKHIDFQKYDSPFDLVNDDDTRYYNESHYDEEREFVDKCPELVGIVMPNSIYNEWTWDEEKEVIRLFMNTRDKSGYDFNAVSKLVNAVRENRLISLEDFNDMLELEACKPLLMMDDSFIDFVHNHSSICSFLDRILAGNPHAFNELMSKIMSKERALDGVVSCVMNYGDASSNLIMHLMRCLFGGGMRGKKMNFNILYTIEKSMQRKALPDGDLRDMYDELKDNVNDVGRLLLENPNFTDKARIDDYIARWKNKETSDEMRMQIQLLLDNVNPDMKKYLYEKYGKTKYEDTTFSGIIADGINENDLPLLPICSDPDGTVKYFLSKNANMPEEFYLKLVNDSDANIASNAINTYGEYHVYKRSSRLRGQIAMAIAGDSREEIRNLLVMRNSMAPSRYMSLPGDLLEKAISEMLSHETSASVKYFLVKNNRTPQGILALLSEDDSSEIRRISAGMSNMPEVLERLSHDPDPDVRMNAAMNPRTPQEARNEVLSDESVLDKMNLTDIIRITYHNVTLSAESIKNLYMVAKGWDPENAYDSDIDPVKFPSARDYDDFLREFLKYIAGNPNTPPSMFRTVFDEYDERFGRDHIGFTDGMANILVRNKSVPLKTLAYVEVKWEIDHDKWMQWLGNWRRMFNKSAYESILQAMRSKHGGNV